MLFNTKLNTVYSKYFGLSKLTHRLNKFLLKNYYKTNCSNTLKLLDLLAVFSIYNNIQRISFALGKCFNCYVSLCS